jgi:hypothetical protein
MGCGADFKLENLVGSMGDIFDDELSDIRCDRL